MKKQQSSSLKIHIANIEQGMPTVEQARIRLEQALRHGRQQKYHFIKLIHGYGSTGKGGAIKKDVSTYLLHAKKSGKIKAFVAGEDFSPFDSSAQEMLIAYPNLRKDQDYSRGNAGITLILL